MLFLKATVILCFSPLTSGLLSFVRPDNHKQMSKAVLSIVEKIRNTRFDVFMAPNNDKSKDIGSDFIKSFKVPIQLEFKLKVIEERRRSFEIIFINNMEGFLSFYDQILIENFYFEGFYIFIFPDARNSDMINIFSLLWKRFVVNAIIILQSTKSIDMFTFMPFGSAGKCGDETVPVKVNEFDETWTTSDIFPRKFNNLYGCAIKCGLFKLEPAIIVEKSDNGSVRLSGFDVDIFNELLKSVNARVNYTVYPIDTGTVYSNGTATGLLGHTIRGDVDVSLRSYSLQLTRRKFLSDTISYFSDKLIMIMPLPMPLNPLLKFVRPMQLEVWYAMGVMIIIASIAIFLIRMIPDNYYKQIFGKRMRDEFLNLLIGFIGLSQTALPEKNFPRFLLMMFLILCLVIRSLYLGSLFNMMKSEIRSKEFTTIHDFYDAGFEFYVYETLSERLNYSEINSR